MIFGRRMGCYASKNSTTNSSVRMAPEEIQKFVNYVQEIFVESAKMSVFPPRLAKKFNLPVWSRFVKAVGSALEIGMFTCFPIIIKIETSSLYKRLYPKHFCSDSRNFW